MDIFKKNIILIPVDFDGISLEKGLLTLTCSEKAVQGNLRCYNLIGYSSLTMGVVINGKIHKFKLSEKDTKNFNFDIPAKVENVDKISCAILQIKEQDYKTILWGSTETTKSWQTTLEYMLEKEVAPNVPYEVKGEQTTLFKDESESSFYKAKNIEKNNFSINKDEKEIFATDKEKFKSEIDEEENETDLNKFIDKIIDITEPKENFSYKDNTTEVFSEENFKKTDEDIVEDDTQNPEFFIKIQSQVDLMFKENPEDVALNEIIPNSKFCKVNFDDNIGYYVFGVIYESEKPKYLCYGIPAKFGAEPPSENSNYYQWLPLDVDNFDADGYYVMYQDANTGENINVEVVS